MQITDTHAHIYVEEFAGDLAAMLQRAGSEGVNKILMPAIDSATHEQMLKVEKLSPGQCYSMMGLHPCSVKENFKEELSLVKNFLGKGSFIAIGEIGLDFYWDKTFVNQQIEAFQQQTSWALELDLPIVIHSRSSIDECIDLVSKQQDGKLKGVFHCFSGNIEQANQITGLGFYLGIGGVLTYKNSGLDKVIEQIDMKHIVLETDAPYLAPVPFRGKRNEVSYIKFVAEKLAEVKSISLEEVAAITTANARVLFGKI